MEAVRFCGGQGGSFEKRRYRIVRDDARQHIQDVESAYPRRWYSDASVIRKLPQFEATLVDI